MIYLETLKKEIHAIFKYKDLIIILFVGPIFLTLFFGGVYVNDYVKDIPIAILDEDGSSLSNIIGDYFITNERFEITNYASSRLELESLIDTGKVHLGLVIPEGFERKVTNHQSPEILAILDGSNLVVSGNAYAQATMIIQTVSAGIEMKLIQGKGVSPKIAKNIALVYNVSERMLFDPKMTYMNYLIVCFVAVFIQQLMLAAMGSLFNRDSDYLSKGHVLQKVLATMSACFIGILPAIFICMMIVVKLFKVFMIGKFWILMILTILFVISLTGPSLIIVSLTKDKIKYSQISFMLSLPTFVSSGCVWPIEQMPKGLAFIIKIFWPLANYAKPLQEVFVKGMDFKTVLPNMLEMGFFSLVWLPIGVILYKNAFVKDKQPLLLTT